MSLLGLLAAFCVGWVVLGVIAMILLIPEIVKAPQGEKEWD